MDETDAIILDVLKENARHSLSDISERANLSIPAIRERIKKLENKGAIKCYTTILNKDFFKKDMSCFIMVTLSNDEDGNTEFFRLIEEEPEILECHFITGEYEYMLKVVTDNSKSLERLLKKFRMMKCIQFTKSTTVLSTVKEKYSI